MIKYETTPEFDSDFKRLCKKYRTLPDDLELVKKAVIELYHVYKIDNNSVFPIPGFCNDVRIACKVKKIASKSFKGKGVNSGLRLIYIYFVKDERVVFVEIYFKGVKVSEDRGRLLGT